MHYGVWYFCALYESIKQKEGGQCMIKEKPIIRKVDGTTKYYCPRCNKLILSTKNMRQSGLKEKHCRECGKGLDWDGIILEVYWAN
jgi:predicted RNA-binding Zn-ribbon protein involved in translation (DUF1610 family)